MLHLLPHLASDNHATVALEIWQTVPSNERARWCWDLPRQGGCHRRGDTSRRRSCCGRCKERCCCLIDSPEPGLAKSAIVLAVRDGGIGGPVQGRAAWARAAQEAPRRPVIKRRSRWRFMGSRNSLPVPTCQAWCCRYVRHHGTEEFSSNVSMRSVDSAHSTDDLKEDGRPNAPLQAPRTSA